MKKKSALLIIVIILIITVFNTKVFTYQYGAYAGYTSAPNEGNCTSCHSGYAMNLSSGSLKISLVDSLGDTVEYYKPGATYYINVNVSFTGRSKFGFEETVRKQLDNSAIGTITPGTGVAFCYGTQNYITHTSSSNTGTNGKTWTSKWVAPASGAGNIVFYANGNAANGDGSKHGDYIYSASLVIADSGAEMGIAQQPITRFTNVYPNPCADILCASFSQKAASQANISLLDLQGRVIKNIFNEYTAQGEHHFNTNMSDVSKGVYFLKIESGGKPGYLKIIKE